MNARGALHAGDRTPLLESVGAPANTMRPRVKRESTRVDLRRLGAIGLVLFCLVTAVGLMRVIAVSNQVLTALQDLQGVPHGASASAGVAPIASAPPHVAALNSTDAVRVLVVYSNGTHLAKLAHAVEQGVRSVIANDSHVRVRTVANASFANDVLWADAVVLGSHVINANVEPKMAAFLSSWALSADLSRKVGAAFVTGAGISAGEELTMVNLLHSMLIFRMIIVGGERWTSAFGASAVVGEGPFGVRPGAPSSSDASFPSLCYSSDPDAVHQMFQDKAIGLGQRVATLAAVLRAHAE